MRMMRINNTPPRGAYCRSIAWKLIFRAALRYFSDSDRSDVDKCDIPDAITYYVSLPGHDVRAEWALTVKRVASPQELFHVLCHDPGNVLQLAI